MDKNPFSTLKRIIVALRRRFQGAVPKLVVWLLLLALPVAAAEGYQLFAEAQAVREALVGIDLTSETALQDFSAAYSESGNELIFLLSVLADLVKVFVFMYAAVFTCERLTGTSSPDGESKHTVYMLRKLLPTAIISYLSTTTLQIALLLGLTACTALGSNLPGAAGVAVSVVLCAAAYVLINALILTITVNMMLSVVLGRTRFLFAGLYVRLLTKGWFARTFWLYAVTVLISSVITALPAAGALLAPESVSLWLWVLTSFTAVFLSGLCTCAYTAVFMQLESLNHSFISRLSFTASGNSPQ